MAELLEVTFPVPVEPGGLLWSRLCPALWVLSSSAILPLAGKKPLSSKSFSLGEKPAWSETSAQKCHLTQQLAHASPGVLRRPLPMSQPRCGPGFALLEEASPGAGFGRLWPLPSPGRLHHPLLPPHLPLPFSCSRVSRWPRSEFWGARRPGQR